MSIIGSEADIASDSALTRKCSQAKVHSNLYWLG